MTLRSTLADLLASPTPALFAGALVLSAAACGQSGLNLGETRAASTVSNYAGSPGGCSTAVVIGLSQQIAQQTACDDTDGFVPFDTTGITITSNSVLPYLEPTAAADLHKVAVNHPLQINSALRTIAQQYLLYSWWQEGGCGITAAAKVGNSNHEGGRAVDVANYSSRITNMSAYGWKHDVPGDVVHFDHTSSEDDRGRDVKAFQELWNANNPNDQISVDGDYGPQTAKRLKASPAGGFPIGPSCASTMSQVAQAPVTVETVDGPDHVAAGDVAHYTYTLKNTGTADWSDATEIAIPGGAASQLYDQNSWMSPAVIGTLPNAVAAGEEIEIDFDIVAPAVTEDTPISQPIILSDSGTQVAAFNLGLTVTTSTDDSNTPSEGTNEPNPPSPEVSGGCAAGGHGAGGLALLALVVPAVVLRRRRTA